MAKLFLVAAVAVVSVSAGAEEIPFRQTAAYRELKTVPSFAVGGVGIAGTTAPGEAAWRVIFRRHDSVSAFGALLSEAAPAGKCYALLGLSLQKKSEFRRVLPAFLRARVSVPTFRGCLLGSESLSTIAGEIQAGDYAATAQYGLAHAQKGGVVPATDPAYSIWRTLVNAQLLSPPSVYFPSSLGAKWEARHPQLTRYEFAMAARQARLALVRKPAEVQKRLASSVVQLETEFAAELKELRRK